MPRPEKVQAVADIKERLEEARAVFMAEYAGLSVKEQQDLRRALRDAGSEFKVYKMTLARLAASEAGRDEVLDLLVGPTGLTFAMGDAATTAKVLQDFSKDHARLIVKGALLGTELLSPERVAQLAELEPREVLLARIAGAFQAPMAAMAGLMAAMPRNLASMIKQLADKAPAPAPEPAAEEATASEATEAEATTEAEEATADEDIAAEATTEAEEATADEATTDEAADEAEEE
ncbi:MAG TPA: 50S ribosomal protein L10 [Acidimicrobiia bacterium]|nr:50S ribosomal protein L10 [Acidimicrobiia bacterium]